MKMYHKLIALFGFGLFVPMHAVVATDVIGSAPSIASVLTKILSFLLSVTGVIAIIGLVIAGLLYFFAAGDTERIAVAKKAVFASVVGLTIALSGLVLMKTLGALFR